MKCLILSGKNIIHGALLIVCVTLIATGCDQQPSDSLGEMSEDTVYILVDHSDTIRVERRDELKRQIRERVEDDLRPNARIILTKIDNQSSLDTTMHERPKYKCDYNKDICEEIGKQIRVFETRLFKSIDRLFENPEISQSPIIESLAALPGITACDSSCHLWIISDMLQRSDLINFYNGIPSFQEAKSDIEWESGFPVIDSSGVKIWQLNRCQSEGKEIQTNPKFGAFWEKYFDHITSSDGVWKNNTIPVTSGVCE